MEGFVETFAGKAVEVVAEVLVSGAVGWLVANMRIGKKIADLKAAHDAAITASEAKTVGDLQKVAVAFRTDVMKLEASIQALAEARTEERVKSSADHTQAAQMAAQLVQMGDELRSTSASLNRIIGLLQGKGVRL